MAFLILNSPILATIQDLGRFGFANIGVTTSGVMDEYSYFMANKLLNNPKNTNILEIGFSNIQIKVLEDTQIAITGAICEFFINNEKKSIWQTYNVKKDDILKIGKILKGVWVYLGVKNGFEIKKEFNSNSTSLKEKLGGIDGKKLKINDILPYKRFLTNQIKRVKSEFIPAFEDKLTLRVTLSYQNDFFQQEEIKKFFSNEYIVTNECNKMAFKLFGEPILCEKNGIISEGISFGSIQIPKDGQPIVLLKERQTMGGYPKIGVVLGIDCFRLSQAKAGTKISFKEISFDEATLKTKDFYNKLS